MGAELGRISGPLLAANLLRDEVDLAFENDLLYFKVNGSPDNVGIKTIAPSTDLEINGTIGAQNLITNSGGTYNFGNFSIYNNTIQQLSGKIYVRPDQSTNPTIQITGIIQTPTLEISDNNFTAVGTNQSITFNTTGTGKFGITGDLFVDGPLHSTGDITLDGNITFGNQTTDLIVFDAEVSSNLLPIDNPGGFLSAEDGTTYLAEDGTDLASDNVNLAIYDLGSPSKIWASINANTLNFVKSTFADIELYQNSIYTIGTNENLILAPNGTGKIVIQNLAFNNNVISNVAVSPPTNDAASIKFKPLGDGVVSIDSTSALKLPIGPTGALQARGQIRFNTTKNRFRGYVPVGQTISLTQLYSVNENTYITPELTENASDNTFRFALNNSVKATLTNSTLFDSRFDLGGIKFENNIITGLTADASFQPSGNTLLGDVFISVNTIGALTTQPLTWYNTGRGYVKFAGSGGVVLPFGTTAERPINPENGEYRYNIDPIPTQNFTLSGVIITGTEGQFSCASTTLLLNDTILISGTYGGTGSIVGYTDPTTYYIISTNGTTTFTLSETPNGSAISTTVGAPSGLTFTKILSIGGEVYSTASNQWLSMGGGGGGSLVNEDEAFAGLTTWALVFNL